jgi:hypothetical protein
MSFSDVILLDLNEFHRLKACEAKMHQLLEEKAKKDVTSAADQEGGGPVGSSAPGINLTSPLPVPELVDSSPPPEIPILHESKISESDPNFLNQTIASDRKGIVPPSNPGFQLPLDSQVDEHHKKQAKEDLTASSSHPWYYIGGYRNVSDSESE